MTQNTLDKSGTNVLHSDKVDTRLTKSEVALANLIADMKFGEILNVELEPGGRDFRRSICPRMQALFVALDEYPRAHKIVVHDAQPTYIEVEGRTPWRHIRRVKL